MNLRKSTLIILPILAIACSSCESNPGWDGHQSSNNLEEVAEEGCKCVYEVMSEFESFDADKVLETVGEYQSGNKQGTDEKFADILIAYASMDAIIDSVDASACMKPIEDAIFAKGLEYEDVEAVFEKHCKLSAFFRF